MSNPNQKFGILYLFTSATLMRGKGAPKVRLLPLTLGVISKKKCARRQNKLINQLH